MKKGFGKRPLALRLLLILFLWGFGGAYTPGYNQDFIIDDVNLRPLNGRIAQTIFKDDLGFIWIGSNAGLFRYDGFEVKSFFNITNDTTSISANHVHAICQDEDGIIWMGTLAGGLCRFDPKTEAFRSFQADPDDDTSLSNNNIFGLDIDQDGNIWMATNGGGISILPASEKSKPDPKFETLEILAGTRLFSIMIDSRNCFWTGVTDGSIVKGQINGGLFEWNVNPSEKQGQSGIIRLLEQGLDVTQLYMDPDQELWISTFDDGLLRWRYGDEKPKLVPVGTKEQEGLSSNFVQGVIKDPHRKGYWIGTENGLDYYDPEAQYWEHYQQDPSNPASISDNPIQSNAMAFDADNRLWLGTWGGRSQLPAARRYGVPGIENRPGGSANNS